MRLHLGRHPLTGRLHPDAAVQVVGDRGDDDDDQHGGEQPVHDEPQERQREDVEADVGVEVRILLTEVDAVREEDPVAPLARSADAGDQAEQQGHDDAHETGAPADQLLVALDELLLGTGRTKARRDAVGDPEVEPAEEEEDAGEDQRQRDLGAEHVLEDARHPERVEPEVVGVEAGEPAQRRDEQHQRNGQHDEDDAAAVRARLSTAKLTGGTHRRGSLTGGDHHLASAPRVRGGMYVTRREGHAALDVARERVVVGVGTRRLVRSHEPPQRATDGRRSERSTIEPCKECI